jgi:hypothetical protein
MFCQERRKKVDRWGRKKEKEGAEWSNTFRKCSDSNVKQFLKGS